MPKRKKPVVKKPEARIYPPAGPKRIGSDHRDPYAGERSERMPALTNMEEDLSRHGTRISTRSRPVSGWGTGRLTKSSHKQALPGRK